MRANRLLRSHPYRRHHVRSPARRIHVARPARTHLRARLPVSAPHAGAVGDDAGIGDRFCDRFGADALALGWTDRQLFGVHSQHGTLRVDYCGAVISGSDKALGVEANRIVFERTSSYRDRPSQEWGPPIWEFAAKGG